VAINAERLDAIQADLPAEPPTGLRLQRLIDAGSRYIQQNLTPGQFSTLHAVANILARSASHQLASRLDAGLATTSSHTLPFASPPPIAFDYQLALDELDSIARTRAGYAFTELPAELQEVVLSLIATRDLTTRKLDLALWLEELLRNAVAFA
jgi:hypothetical protein